MDLSSIRAAIKTNATDATDGGSLTLIGSRIKLGLDMHANNNTHLATMASAGPYMIVHPGALEDDPEQTGGGRMYRIPCSLYVGYDREADQMLVDAESLLEDIRAQLRAGGASSVTWDEPEFNHERVPGYGRWRMTVRQRGC